MPDGTQDASRTHRGRSAEELLSENVRAAREAADVLRTTLGPNGMSKLLVDPDGMAIVTNNGGSVLKEMALDHPMTDVLLEVVSAQSSSAGDGTTTAVVLAGALLERAAGLVERGLHPTTIASGYSAAAEEAAAIFDRASLDAGDGEILAAVAGTALAGTVPDGALRSLADAAVAAARSVAERSSDLDDVRFEKLVGGTVGDAYLMNGVFLRRGRVTPEMPYGVEDAGVTLLDVPLETAIDADGRVTVAEPDAIEESIESGKRALSETIADVAAAGVTVLVCQKGIDRTAQQHLADHGIYAVHRVSSEDLPALARSTGAWVLSDLSVVEPEYVGTAGRVVEETIDGETCTRVENGGREEAVTVVLRGGTRDVLDEVHRSMQGAIRAVRGAIADGRALPGGGAAEVRVAAGIRDAAAGVETREALAMEAFAEAIETIPRTLAEGAGLSPMDALVELRSRHAAGETTVGIDGHAGEPRDMIEERVIDSVRVKRRAIWNAVEAATMVLGIDGVVPASDRSPPTGPEPDGSTEK